MMTRGIGDFAETAENGPRVAVSVFQRLLHQVADCLGGWRSGLAAGVCESVREVDVLSIGIQLRVVS